MECFSSFRYFVWLGILCCLSVKGFAVEKPKEVAGKADVLRHVKKQFGSFEGIGENGEVRLMLEGNHEVTSWPLLPDAEIRVDGWWGRVDQFAQKDRVWVWFAVNRKKDPTAILLLADEISEQDIHGKPYTVESVEGGVATFYIPGEKKVAPRKLEVRGRDLNRDDVGYLQSANGAVRRFLTVVEFEKAKQEQRDFLRQRWRSEGLPGTVSFLHPLSGEMELYLDHEAMRWARYLQKGDEVVFGNKIDGSAQVKFVEPWRERTRLRIVSNSGMDQFEMKLGQRVLLKVREPPVDVQQSDLPTDIGRLDDEEQRIDWFLSTLYCPCGIAGDRCTGMYYTLASCNVNTCGAPNDMKAILKKYMSEGMGDVEIFEELRAQKGRDVWQPHLLR
ncbi:MAG: hypothetical protein CMO55_24055 [Verrucomicrobiales bacterium]|nr:hypothetical protein [Verrucomicrobiales bacterium]